MAKFCPSCGDIVKMTDNFCSSCGKPLSSSKGDVLIECSKCKGTGVVEEYRGSGSSSIFTRAIGTREYTCDVCGGKGVVRI